MKKVVNGTVRFREEGYSSRQALFAELANGQSPEVLFVTCADSRIDPCLVTHTDPGDLFVCRNAGNIVPPHSHENHGTNASIEYAVAVLGVRDIVVCGHTDCGAMKGAMNLSAVEELPQVRDWLEHSRAAVEIAAQKHRRDDNKLLRVIEENVLLQLQHLRSHPAVAARLATGDIGLHGWVYDIETGGVTCHDAASDRFEPIEERYADLLDAPAGSGAAA